ncbi:uncharacterized protein LOC143636719 [Bidens hawaiensis]|uniref:uncharacterized protein LOC143636719 n=1 Tax=Bidens hawaiensis TaxID=980011 RepID=UPI0040498F62
MVKSNENRASGPSFVGVGYLDETNVDRKYHESENDCRQVTMSIKLPCVEDVAEYVNNDDIFCLLYGEMWCRQLFATTSSPTLMQRIHSWRNYVNLFELLLTGMLSIQLPYQWLWDMIDEFVNQFQSFCHYRASEIKTEQDVAILKLRHRALSVKCVLSLLQAFVSKSSIIQILERAEDSGLQLLTATTEDVRTGRSSSNVLNVLGYFSMVGLLRVHCLLGSYRTGLGCLDLIDISKQGFYTSLVPTHVTTVYHYGFANLMLGRYADAIHEFNNFLVHIFKNKQPQQDSPQILNKIEQMYALLAICVSLCPQRQLIDKNVYSQLMDKYGEKMSRMLRYDDESFALYQDLLSYAWPAFNTPFAPNSGHQNQIFDNVRFFFAQMKWQYCFFFLSFILYIVQEGRARYDDDDEVEEELSTAYPAFFINHNQLEAVIVNMLKLKLK